MAGATFLAGEAKVRPGVYVRAVGAGSDQPALARGIVAALVRASWGPLGVATLLTALEQVAETFNTGATTDVATEAFRGGCRKVLGYRLGTGGVVATYTIKDTATPTAANAVRIDAKYVGTVGNALKLTLRDALVDTTKRELLVYEGTVLRETISFAKGATGVGEPQALVDAVAAAGSRWITATKLADGTKLLEALAGQALAGGTDPTVLVADYSTALAALESLDWNVLAIDSEDAAVHSTVQTYVNRVRGDGKRVLAVVGEPTSVALATRLTNAKALNHAALVYVANGFTGTDGTSRQGYKAAARVAGMVAAAPVTASLTHAAVAGAADLVGGLSNTDIESAIKSGALVFTLNAQRQVQIEYGITTLVTLAADQDAGWKKIRRVRTRDELMDRIVAATDPLIGRVNNDPDGRATLRAAMQGVVNEMAREGALLAGGTVVEDPANAPAGDRAYFVVAVDDLDSVEKLYLTFQFRFAPA